MKCRLIRKHISLYIDARLDSGMRQRVETHLEGCPSCRSHVRQLRLAMEALSSLDQPQARAGGWERLRYQLEKQSAPAPVPAPRLWRPALLGAAGAVAVALAALALFQSQPGKMAGNPAPSPDKGLTAHSVASAPDTSRQTAAPKRAAPVPPEASVAAVPATAASGNPRRMVRSAEERPAPRSPLRRSSGSERLASRPALPASGAEPDPEFTREVPREPASVAQDVAESVSTGMEPLVVAAQNEDPMDWLTDIKAEDWL